MAHCCGDSWSFGSSLELWRLIGGGSLKFGGSLELQWLIGVVIPHWRRVDSSKFSWLIGVVVVAQ